MFAAIKLFLGRFITPFLWKFLLGLSVAGLIGWAVVEFQARGYEIKALETAKQQMERWYSSELATERAAKKQAQANLQEARDTASRRQGQIEELRADIEEINQMERSNEEQQLGCTQHPAIRSALERLRNDGKTEARDKDSGSSAD